VCSPEERREEKRKNKQTLIIVMQFLNRLGERQNKCLQIIDISFLRNVYDLDLSDCFQLKDISN
jgi:hypothetical protein